MIALAALCALLIAGCPSSGTEQAGGEGSGGGEEIMFPDEAEAREREAEAPPASDEVQRAEQLLAQGNAEEALPLLQAAVQANARDPRAQLDLGLAHEMLGNAAEAETAYRAAVDADEAFAEALNNLGLLLRDLERLDEAIEYLRRAVEVREDFASAWLNLALAL